MANFTVHLPKLAKFGVPRITLALTEKYVRSKLGLKKDQPLAWNGIPLTCIGSERWRKNQDVIRRAKAMLERRANQP